MPPMVIKTIIPVGLWDVQKKNSLVKLLNSLSYFLRKCKTWNNFKFPIPFMLEVSTISSLDASISAFLPVATIALSVTVGPSGGKPSKAESCSGATSAIFTTSL